jgi:hypothetical protein
LYGRHVTNGRADPGPGPELDAARALVVGRDLTAPAIAALTDTVRSLPIEALGPVKQLLKRFFSDQPWTARNDEALADAVGGGSDEVAGRTELAPDLTLVWGWNRGRFFLRLLLTGFGGAQQPDRSPEPTKTRGEVPGEVVPEVTPSPRTMRFGTRPLHDGASRVYNSIADAAGDTRAARLFDEFDAVTNVMIGPDFVAITISRADQWDSLLAPMLRAVTEEFTEPFADDAPDASEPSPGLSPDASAEPPSPGDHPNRTDAREPRRLERAWAELGALRADRADDLERILAASSDAEAARRQVAAALLSDAPPDAAARAWERLLGDPSRIVRRSAIDAVVDAARDELRPLLERALADPDAWIRWKAVRGISALGVTTSRALIDDCASDPDFRVRLEATRALAGGPT